MQTIELSARVNKIRPSLTLAISAKAKELKANGIDVVGFGAGEPDFDTPLNIKQAAIDAINDGFTKYTPVGGINELKDAIINKLKKDNGLDYERDEIIVSCGAKHSLYNIFQAFFQEGDEAIITAPYWISYPDMVCLAGAEPVIIPTSEGDSFKLNTDQLDSAITNRTKAFILNSPSNPTGSAYSREELERLSGVIVDRDIWVISDEIYEKMVYDSFAFSSIASLGTEIKERTIVVNGVSKSHSMTGWRIGYTAGPKELIKAITKIQGQSTSNPTSIAQKAAEEALCGSQDIVKEMVKEFDRRRKFVVKRLNEIKDVSCFNPQGAFYVFPDVSKYYGKKYKNMEISSSVTISEYLLDNARVAVVPGSAFGSDGNIRISYATSMEDLERGLDRIEEALDKIDD